MAAHLEVHALPVSDGWRVEVVVVEPDGRSEHEVFVTREAHASFAQGASSPEALVRASFEFLLEREPKEEILRRFELPIIGDYFPEYPEEIARRLQSSR